jgi:hypothetical protein
MWGRRGVAIVIVCAMSAAALGLEVSTAGAGEPARMVLAASGKVGDFEWAVGMARFRGERCYGTRTLNDGWEGNLKVCGKEEPPTEWRQVVGGGPGGSEPSFQFTITPTRVRTLRLLLAFSDGHTAWRSLRTRILNAKQAATSHMPRDFRFAVIVEPTGFCVEAVEAIDRRGRAIQDETVPCER